MTNLNFKFYSVLKNEDACPYIGGNVIAVADGLGGSGSAVHAIDRIKHGDMYADVTGSAFGDMQTVSPGLQAYIEELIAPMIDAKDDTSALWASRIVIARCVYALTEGEFKNADLSNEEARKELAMFIQAGLCAVVEKFGLQNGKFDEQLLLPTTLAFIRYTEQEHSVVAEVLWAGDSRCYAVTPDGLKVLSVDDEDDSGSITNLFYAYNGNVSLNYLRHEIEKPCALLAVSDGVFDPFALHENLGMEYALLSAIKENDSPEGVAEALRKIYSDIHGDDATMVFVPFGIQSFEDLQIKLSTRTDRILAIYREQSRMSLALEVANQTEEEVSHYVSSRTVDRYDYIVAIIADMLERGGADVVITPELAAIVESAESTAKDYFLSTEQERKQMQDQGLRQLNEYVKIHPEVFLSEILTPLSVQFNDPSLSRIFADLKVAAEELVRHKKKIAKLQVRKLDMERKRQNLHLRVMEKIRYHCESLGAFWSEGGVREAYLDNRDNLKLRGRYLKIHDNLRAWEDLDNRLFFNWRVVKPPKDDEVLVSEVCNHISEFNSVLSDIKSSKKSINALEFNYNKCWDKLFHLLKYDTRIIPFVLSPEAVQKFGLYASGESLAAELSKCKRDRILSELKAKKEVIVPAIVKALAANYNKTSVIDGQYNASKLHLFRTYYHLKATGNGDVKAIEEQVKAIEKEYTGLINK